MNRNEMRSNEGIGQKAKVKLSIERLERRATPTAATGFEVAALAQRSADYGSGLVGKMVSFSCAEC